MLKTEIDKTHPSSRLVLTLEDTVTEFSTDQKVRIVDYLYEIQGFTAKDFYGNTESYSKGTEIPLSLKSVDYDTYYIANKMFYDERSGTVFIHEFDTIDSMDAGLFFCPLIYDNFAKISNYICSVEFNTEKKELMVIYRWFPHENYVNLEEYLEEFSVLQISKGSSDCGRFTNYVYKLPLRFSVDVNYVIDGKFNKLSKPYKEKFMKFWNYSNEHIQMKRLNDDVEERKRMAKELGITVQQMNGVPLRSKPKF